MQKNPYKNLDKKYFWKQAIGNINSFELQDIWIPKYQIKKSDYIITFGSCFAQHIGRALVERGFNWLNTEKKPFGMTATHSEQYNYGIFSCRTGNIYTTTLMRQWIEFAFGRKCPNEYWVIDERYYDPLRPKIEPNGFSNVSELETSRACTLQALKKALLQANFFFFTLGLTESWFNSKDNFEYPMCPGAITNDFNPNINVFRNHNFNEIYSNLEELINFLYTINPNLKIILTVSPVPSVATYSKNHVLVANMESKSILRAVAGEISKKFKHVDYFPSYELITSSPFQGVFYEPNKRSVSRFGVDFVMNHFFQSLGYKDEDSEKKPKEKTKMDIKCEEELLETLNNGF